MPHQREGISWLRQHGSGILADQPGLGKTLQTIAAMDPPAIVVCPAVMRAEWADEVRKWRPGLSTVIVSGAKPYETEKYLSADVVVINYDILDKHAAALLEAHRVRPFTSLVCDEAHVLKTLDIRRKKGKPPTYEGSGRAVSTAWLARVIPRRIMLSATPVLNRPVELWPLLHMIDPERWDDLTRFGQRYCDGFLESVPRKGSSFRGKAWNFEGASNIPELHRKLVSDHMIRRDKTVLSLPYKRRKTELVNLPHEAAKEYQFAEREFLAWVLENGGPEKVARAKKAEKLAKMTALRGLSARGKVPHAASWCIDRINAGKGPLVVMAHHAEVLKGLEEGLREAKPDIRVGSIIGGQSEKSRKRDKEAFQGGDLDVILCSIMAAGVGLTLTRSCEMAFVERSFRAMDLVQAEDRIHRIGQTRDVSITYFDARGTIDEKIARLLMRKTATIAGVIDGEALDEHQAAQRVFGSMFGDTEQAQMDLDLSAIDFGDGSDFE